MSVRWRRILGLAFDGLLLAIPAAIFLGLALLWCWDCMRVLAQREARPEPPRPAAKGYICPCGNICMARRGGICMGRCGCPINH